MSAKLNEWVRGEVLLAGTVPYDEVEEALRAGAEGLRGHVVGLADGEVGPRQQRVGP